MFEKSKNASENQQKAGSQAAPKTKGAKMPGPLAEPKSVPAKSRRDSDRTIPLIYPPDILDGEKAGKNGKPKSEEQDAGKEQDETKKPIAEPKSVPAKSRRDSDRTIPLIYPPDILDGEKAGKNGKPKSEPNPEDETKT